MCGRWLVKWYLHCMKQERSFSWCKFHDHVTYGWGVLLAVRLVVDNRRRTLVQYFYYAQTYNLIWNWAPPRIWSGMGSQALRWNRQMLWCPGTTSLQAISKGNKPSYKDTYINRNLWKRNKEVIYHEILMNWNIVSIRISNQCKSKQEDNLYASCCNGRKGF